MNDVITHDALSMTYEQRMDELLACERSVAALQARELVLLDALRRDPLPEPAGKEFVRDDLRVTLRWSESVVHDRLDTATVLCGPLRATLDALSEGSIAYRQAEALALAAAPLAEATAIELEAAALPFAATHDLAATRRKLNREILRLTPADEAYATAYEQRAVWTAPDSPGMTRFGALLPAEGAAYLTHALEVLASASADDDGRTKQQKMADALVDLATSALAGGCAHCVQPARAIGPAVNVTIALSTLLGLDAQAGELNGEPIPVELARALAHDENATWRRLVTDDLGHLIDYGRSMYRPPVGLRDHVVARDRTCRFPGCRRRTETAELDHVLAWEHGGRTNAGSLLALCVRHHKLKHEAAGWSVRLAANGQATWTSPAGKARTTEAATYPTDRTSPTGRTRLTDGRA